VWVLLMDIKAAFPSVVRGRLVCAMKGKWIDGDLIRWTQSLRSDRTVEMVIEHNALQSHPVEAGVPQGSRVSPSHFTIYTVGMITWVEERVQEVKGHSLVDDLGWVAIGRDVNQVVNKLEACASESIE